MDNLFIGGPLDTRLTAKSDNAGANCGLRPADEQSAYPCATSSNSRNKC